MVREEIDRAWGLVDPLGQGPKKSTMQNDLIESERYLSGYA